MHPDRLVCEVESDATIAMTMFLAQRRRPRRRCRHRRRRSALVVESRRCSFAARVATATTLVLLATSSQEARASLEVTGTGIGAGGLRPWIGDFGETSQCRTPRANPPVRVCTASVQTFSARCDATGRTMSIHDRMFNEDALVRDAPGGEWCPGEDVACGYDVDIFREAARRTGLREGCDFVFVCRGVDGFTPVIDALARGGAYARDDPGFRDDSDRAAESKDADTATPDVCDIGVSAITIATSRVRLGIAFSRPILRTWLSALTFATPRPLGTWAIFRPLSAGVWAALLATVTVTPVLIFAVDSLFSDANSYIVIERGRVQVVRSLGEIAWACVAHILLLDFIQAQSAPARIIMLGFGFLVFTVSNTYTASLVAVLTARPPPQRDVGTLADMRVATSATYADRIRTQTDANVTWVSKSLPYTRLVRHLREGVLDAVVFDDAQLSALSAADQTCTLDTTMLSYLPFDIGFAYRDGFAGSYPGLIESIDDALLFMQQQGVYQRTMLAHHPPERACEDMRALDSQQVQIPSLRGVWVILGIGYIAGTAFALASYARLRAWHPHQTREVEARVRARLGLADRFDRLVYRATQKRASGRATPVSENSSATVALNSASASRDEIDSVVRAIAALHAHAADVVPEPQGGSSDHTRASSLGETSASGSGVAVRTSASTSGGGTTRRRRDPFGTLPSTRLECDASVLENTIDPGVLESSLYASVKTRSAPPTSPRTRDS